MDLLLCLKHEVYLSLIKRMSSETVSNLHIDLQKYNVNNSYYAKNVMNLKNILKMKLRVIGF